MSRKVKIILNPMADMGHAFMVARDLRAITQEHGNVDWSGTVYPGHAIELAKQAGVSRSVLAERFSHFLGVPPMAYLTRWRLQLGAQMLASTSRSVAQVAVEVGYESEPAFNRAFKREFGSPPARFRTKSKVAAAAQ